MNRVKLSERFIRWFNISVDYVIHFNEDISANLKGKLLDIGCGNKQEIFSAKVEKYIGLEIPSAEEINARGSAIKADVYGDALDLPFKNGSFDSAVAITLLEHLNDPQKAVLEAYRVLRKGGIFACVVPFVYKLHMAPYDYFRFTIYGIRHILETAGFRIIKIEDTGGMWKAIGSRLGGYFYSDILGLGYGPDDRQVKPKKYLLPLFLPIIFFVVAVCRFLDKLHCVKKDTILYYCLCVKD